MFFAARFCKKGGIMLTEAFDCQGADAALTSKEESGYAQNIDYG
jgi:hypothetical protein